MMVDLVLQSILPKPIIVSKEKFDEIKADFDKCKKETIKFRRYKKDEKTQKR